jgi:hypothetical protein
MTASIVAGVAVIVIAGISRYAWTRIKASRGRSTLTITLELSDELSRMPWKYYLFRVREGPDDAPLINRSQPFTVTSPTRRETQISYPVSLGLQFKCYADWTDSNVCAPSLDEVTTLFERNGWQDVSIDGLHHGRFWFIVSSYATKNTEDVNTYTNNWLPAGPEPA